MIRLQRSLIGLFLPLALAGAHIFASNAMAQKVRETFVYSPPTVSLTADQAVVNTCEGDSAAAIVHLNARASSPGGNPIRYRWTTNAGRIEGDGPNVGWNLSGVRPGAYKAFLVIDTGSGTDACEAFANTALVVKCTPPPRPQPVCPNINITCPDRVKAGEPVTFASTLSGGSGNIPAVYYWTVSAGRIIEGQGTNQIKVDTTSLAGQTLQATLTMGGYNVDCSASCSIQFPAPLACRKFDEYPYITRNDEKARLDNLAIELQGDPTSTAYIVVSPGQGGRAGQAQTRTTRIVDYLVNSRGFDPHRIVKTVGPTRSNVMVELLTCPQGAVPPAKP
ncbi:MAG: hypothetical protein ABI967_12450 [bacterium]